MCITAAQQHMSVLWYRYSNTAAAQHSSAASAPAAQAQHHILQQTATQHQQRHSTPAGHGQHSSVSRSRATQQTAAQHRLLRYSAAPLISILQLCSFAAVMQFCCAVRVRMLLYMC